MKKRVLIKELDNAECQYLDFNPYSAKKECTNMAVTGRWIEMVPVDTSKCNHCKFFKPEGKTLRELKEKITPAIEEEIQCYTECRVHSKAEALADIVLNALLKKDDE